MTGFSFVLLILLLGSEHILPAATNKVAVAVGTRCYLARLFASPLCVVNGPRNVGIGSDWLGPDARVAVVLP